MFRFSLWGRAAVGIAICVSVATVSGASVADDSPTGPVSLSLREAIDRAQVRSPDVIMSGHAVREAMARRVGAGLIMPVNPRVSVDARPGVNMGTAGSLGYSS